MTIQYEKVISDFQSYLTLSSHFQLVKDAIVYYLIAGVLWSVYQHIKGYGLKLSFKVSFPLRSSH